MKNINEAKVFDKNLNQSIPEKFPQFCKNEKAMLLNNPRELKYLISKGVCTFKVARLDIGSKEKNNIHDIIRLFF